MKVKLPIGLVLLALVLTSCESTSTQVLAASSAQSKPHPPQNFSRERLDDIREDLSDTYRDTTLPMPQRVQAFDTLLSTFDAGTPETVVEKYLRSPPKQEFVLSSGEPEGGDGHETMGLTAPDGTNRWLHFYEDLEHGIEARIAN